MPCHVMLCQLVGTSTDINKLKNKFSQNTFKKRKKKGEDKGTDVSEV